jgi:hypothetical protein
VRQPTFPRMREKASGPESVILALLVVLAAAGIAFGGGGGSSSAAGGATAGAEAAAARVAPIARRVETIRGLRFKQLPKPLIVTPAQTRADNLREVDRATTPEERQVAGEVLVLLGLLKSGTDLRAVEGSISTDQVAGYYDTRRKRLAIVAGPLAGSDVVSQITLAHELDHALDDQAIGIHAGTSVGADDAQSAYTALIEGIATSVMDDYARRYIKPSALLGSAASSLGPSSSTAGIPPYILSSLLFSYISGEKFVNQLREVAHGWKLVNYALKSRHPRSTEQIIHPDKYLVDERPVPVALKVRPLLPGWKRATHGTIGEFDTDQILKRAVSDAAAGDAAAGWGGGTYELWTAGASRNALVLGWAWDTPLDAKQSDRALRTYVQKRPGGAAMAMHVSRGLTTTLAIGPDAATAGRLASGAAAGR